MTIAIRITPELVEWVQEHTNLVGDEAQAFAQEFAGVLYFTGGLTEAERQAAAAPELLAACEAARYYIGEIMVTQDNYREPVSILHQLDAAIAKFKGE